jgi:hypothetical protein
MWGLNPRNPKGLHGLYRDNFTFFLILAAWEGPQITFCVLNAGIIAKKSSVLGFRRTLIFRFLMLITWDTASYFDNKYGILMYINIKRMCYIHWGTYFRDISFQSENTKFQPFSRTDIEVTGEQIASGLIAAPLQVRRGSEPALNQLVPATAGGTNSAAVTGSASAGNGSPAASSPTDPTKRWSATPIVVGDEDEMKDKKSSHQKVSKRNWIDVMEALKFIFPAFYLKLLLFYKTGFRSLVIK